MKRITIVVSTNERAEVVQTYIDEGLDVIGANIPYDIELYTERGLVAIERKVFPSDLLASVDDGRLAKECAAMREASPFSILISEGRGRYKADGRLLLGRRPSRWTRPGIRNLFRSIDYVEGARVETTDSIRDTAACLRELYQYFNQDYHLSLRVRQKFESSWLSPTYEERFIFYLQGCGPSIAAIRASTISKVFRSPLEIASAYADGTLAEKLMAIPGISKRVTDSFIKFYKGEM